LQDPPKFTQIRTFGLKTNHLATLAASERLLCKLGLGAAFDRRQMTTANEGRATLRPELFGSKKSPQIGSHIKQLINLIEMKQLIHRQQ
jgi:hypothetical protein